MTTAEGQTDPLDEEYLLVPGVAKMLGRTDNAVRWMRANGVGPRSAKVGGKVMYRKSDVVAWIESEFAKEEAKRA